MKKTASLILFLLILYPVIKSFSGASNSFFQSQCVSIVLKVIGDGNDIYSIESFSHSQFTGIVKEKYLYKTDSDINIIVQDENGELIFDGFINNPLSQLIESFEPDGTIKKIDLKRKSEYVNLRFPIVGNVKRISVKCYRLSPGHDKILISEFKLDLQ